MAILATEILIAIRGVFWGQAVQIGQWFEAQGAAFITADAVGVGEAFWNDIKTDWRALHVGYANDRTTSIFVSEPGITGAYGEFAVPTGEQLGTRTAPGSGSYLPTFVAAGFRETVATRVTRPGQKRVWGLFEGDVDDDGAMAAGYTALLNTFAAHLTAPIILGVPVATGVLQPIVARIDVADGSVIAQQDVVGYLTNPYVTSQVSRKVGRGN